MKKQFRKSSLLRGLLSLLLLVTMVGNAWGEESSVTLDVAGSSKWTNNAVSKDGVTMTITSGSPTSNTSQTRLSSGAAFKIEAGTGKKVVSAEITTNSTNTYVAPLASTTSTYTGSTCTVSGTKATITVSTGYTSIVCTNLGGAIRITSVKVKIDDDVVDNRTAVNMSTFTTAGGVTSIVKGNTLATSVTNDQSGWTAAYTYSSSNESVATVAADGTITAVAKGTAKIKAALNVDKDDATYKAGTTTYKEIEITVTNPTHKVYFYSNGTTLNEGGTDVEEGESIVFPDDPSVDDVVFMGWTNSPLAQAQEEAPTMVNKSTEKMGENALNYYAVYAIQDGDPATEQLTQTLAYDTWTYSGTTTDKSTYRLFGNNAYIESASFDLSKLSKVVVYGGTFGGSSYKNLTIGDGTKTWKSVTVSGSSESGTNTYTNGTALTGNGTLRVTSNSGDGSNNGVRIKKVEIYTMVGGYNYSNYCTTVALDPQPTIQLSANTLAEYAGNTNSTITVGVSENTYTGTLSVASDKESVATATIVDGKVKVVAVAAGTATLTVTAPAVTGFRKNTATIEVTVSEKLAHGLAFNATELNLTVGATEFTEPTLTNPNSLPVVYSLEYAKAENVGKVATINETTGKITLADPSLSTETQGAVTVKATTVGDNSHAAGYATYNLVVVRKVTTTSWSNNGAAVNIDSDEINTLPTATNDGSRNLAYESSNTGVATIDANGAVTFVAYGTTTITAKTSATSEYAATSASYELTFAPKYTVTFKVNGQSDVVLRETASGAGVTPPSVDDVNAYTLAGWKKAAVETETTDAQTFETLTDGKYKPTETTTLYAVYKLVATDGESGSYTLDWTEDGVSDATTGYGKANEFTAKDGGKWIIKAYNNSGMQINSGKNASIKVPTCPSNISSIEITAGTAQTFSFSATDYTGTNSPTAIASSSSSKNATINLSDKNVTTGYVYTTSGSTAITKIVVNYDAPTTVYYASAPTTSTNITISAAGYTTYYNSKHAYTMPAETEGYVAYLDGSFKFEKAYNAGDVVPAATPLVLKGSGDKTLNYTTGGTAPEHNDLIGTATDLTAEQMAAANVGDNEFFALSRNKAKTSVGFYWVKEDGSAFAISAGKAYLVYSKSALDGAGAKGFSFDDAEASGIASVEATENNGVAYNIAGQRVNANAKGIVIINGKKYFNK